MTGRSALRVLLRLLLRSFPGEWRLRYGEEIAAIALRRVERARRQRGAGAALGLATRECLGVVGGGIAARLRRRATGPAAEPASRPRRSRAAAGLDPVAQALRLTLRRLARQPGFALLAVVPLALGVGATVAIFAVFHAILLRPLPFADPTRLVSLWEKNPERGWHQAQVAAANYLDWKEAARSFAGMAAHNDWLEERILLADAEPSVVLASEVTGDFFEVLGVAPATGRTFGDRDTWRGPEPAAVLSHRFWRRRYGADPGILGRTLELDGVSHRVLGVMPAGFEYPFRDVDLWVPVAWDPALREQVSFRRAHGMRVVGRLAPGLSVADATAELEAIASRLEALYPETNAQMGAGITPLREWIVGDSRGPLQILMAAVAFVLLIACANVSNLLIARSNQRSHERRIRIALGAAGRRLFLESFAESGVLAALAGAGGLVLGAAGVPILLALAPDGLPRGAEVSIGPAVVALAGLAGGVAFLFGAAPAWRAASAEPRAEAEALRTTTESPRARRLSAALVACEVALALPLVFGAGLMARTLAQLWRIEPGFEAGGVLAARVMLPATRYDDAASVTRFYRALLEELRGIPEARAVALSTRLPFRNARWSSDFTADGWPPDRFGIGVRHDEVTPGLFETLGVPLVRGRDFDLADGLASEPVVIVNRALAGKYFPGENPIGRRVAFDRAPDADSIWRTIVGIVGDVRRESLGLEETPSFYAPLLQDTARGAYLQVRAEGDPLGLVAALRARLRAVDPALPLFEVTTLDAVVEESVTRERFLLTLLGVASGIALALAGVGVFSVVLHSTTRRLREIGIRVALGASQRSVVALVMLSGLRPVAAGLAAGSALTPLFARSMSGLVYGVRPLDPPTLAAVTAVVLGIAGLACVTPALLAMRADPTRLLRSD